MPKKKLSLEEAFKKLDDILKKLESGEVDLEQSINLFEEAMALSEECRKQLTALEKRVKILVTKDNGDYIEQDMQE